MDKVNSKIKILCPKCHGRGKVPDMLERIATLGISWLFDKMIPTTIGWDKCERCNGKGRIKVEYKPEFANVNQNK